MSKATLLLQDGTVFYGRAVAAPATAFGELCFNTGMTGYQEIFSDPSYAGQMMVTTHTHIGNYGVQDEEAESKGVHIRSLICKNFSDNYSRHSASTSLADWLDQHRIPYYEDFDTRAIVRHIRSKGAMNAIISSETDDLEELTRQLNTCPPMNGLELASVVSTHELYTVGSENAKYNVAVLDYGIKTSILRELTKRDCQLHVYPARTLATDIDRTAFDGFFLSNGPGDPASMDYAVACVTKLLESKKPVFGICLGHQILARTQGATTKKMKYGHRGINHPVMNLLTNRAEITSQNHGFALEIDSVKQNGRVEITHINLNDDSVEGIRLKEGSAFSVQYHPEAGRSHDSRYLFDDFVDMLAASRK